MQENRANSRDKEKFIRKNRNLYQKTGFQAQKSVSHETRLESSLYFQLRKVFKERSKIWRFELERTINILHK